MNKEEMMIFSLKSSNKKQKGGTHSTSRWLSQKWLFDSILSLLGPEQFTGGSLSRSYDAIGIDIQKESLELRSRIRKFEDITRECKKLASSRETVAREAESQGHLVTARENYFISSLMFASARWPIWEDGNPELLELNLKMTECYQKYAAVSDHYIERVEIPFEGRTIYAYLHLPHERVVQSRKTAQSLRRDRHRAISHGMEGKEGKLPCVVVIPGMDTFKEEQVRLYGDKFLQRGFAVLAVDGPGQGETRIGGLKVTVDNYDRVGKVIMNHLVRLRLSGAKSAIIDGRRIGLAATSFGTYWGARIIALDHRYVVGTYSSVCHEPGMRTIFNSGSPSYKPRHMWMCGIYDEDEFDHKYCSKLTLEGVGERITQPILIAAGQDDPISPIQHTYDFFNRISSNKKKLLVYEGEVHGISDPRLPNRIGDFVEDALSEEGNKRIKGGAFLLERGTGWKTAKPINLS